MSRTSGGGGVDTGRCWRTDACELLERDTGAEEEVVARLLFGSTSEMEERRPVTVHTCQVRPVDVVRLALGAVAEGIA